MRNLLNHSDMTRVERKERLVKLSGSAIEISLLPHHPQFMDHLSLKSQFPSCECDDDLNFQLNPWKDISLLRQITKASETMIITSDFYNHVKMAENQLNLEVCRPKFSLVFLKFLSAQFYFYYFIIVLCLHFQARESFHRKKLKHFEEPLAVIKK